MEFVFDTVCSVALFDQADKTASARDGVYNDIFSRLREIENLMSVTIPSSDISRIKDTAGVETVQIDNDVFEVIEKAVYFAQLSDGAFDPSIRPLVSLWDINSDNPRVPSREEIELILPLINWQNIELDAQTHSVFLKKSGMALDLGAIAKGYAADEAASIIRNAGINSAIIEFGGNIVIVGENKNKRPWRVGIQNPNDNRGVHLGIIQVSVTGEQQSIVTSGINERFFEKDGKRYHHIFSPSSGYPVENELLSVTVITPNSIDADALSTAVFVLGYEAGRKLIDSLPDTEAVFIFRDNVIRKTSGVDFSLTDKSFTIET